MAKRGPRPVVYICIGMDPAKPGEYVSKEIQAISQVEATNFFLEQTKIKAKNIYGPYRKKRAQILENTRSLKFADQTRKAVYNDWEVNAMFLKEPENHAYLLFLKRVDGQKQAQPKGPIVVPISDLRFNDE